MKSVIFGRKAFTLAEVLITLGIIGVVAAMTIPNLITKIHEQRMYTVLKGTQSVLANAIRMAEEEYGDMGGWGLQFNSKEADAKKIADNLRPFLKFGIDCGTKADNDGFCCPKVMYKYLNGGTHGTKYYSVMNEYYKVKLMNGVSIWWRSGTQDEYKNNEKAAVFFVDINGAALPNMIGKDFHTFQYEKGGLRPTGGPGNMYDGDCNMKGIGWSCTYYALQNKNMNYPKK